MSSRVRATRPAGWFCLLDSGCVSELAVLMTAASMWHWGRRFRFAVLSNRLTSIAQASAPIQSISEALCTVRRQREVHASDAAVD